MNNRIAEVTGQSVKKQDQAKGEAQIIEAEFPQGDTRDIELYQMPGFASGATNNDTVVVVPIEGGAYKIAVASQNYTVQLEVEKGETKLYSTDSHGSEKKALLTLKPDGKVILENDDQDLKGLIDELIDEIKAIVTTGSPVTQTISGATQAKFELLRTKFHELLDDPAVI